MAHALLTYLLAAAACTVVVLIARLVMGGAGEAIIVSTLLSFVFFLIVGAATWTLMARMIRQPMLARSFAAWGVAGVLIFMWDFGSRVPGRSLNQIGDMLANDLPLLIGLWVVISSVWGTVFQLRTPTDQTVGQSA